MRARYGDGAEERVQRLVVALFAAGLGLAAGGCTESDDGANPDPNCHPLATTGCALPWPSSRFLRAEATSATGYRLALPAALLPVGASGLPTDPTRLNLRDGFSPATTLLWHTDSPIDPAQLPPEHDPVRSLASDASVQLLDRTTGERVLLFAELDGNASRPEDRALLIRPLVRLQPNRTYVAVLRRLVDTAGKRIESAPFEALKQGAVSTPNLATEVDRYRDLFPWLDQQGLPRAELTLAWDLHTGSDTQLLGNLIQMRDEGLRAWDDEQLSYDVTQTTEGGVDGDPLWFELTGTFDVPTYLAADDDSAVLQVDADGRPVRRGVQKFPLVIHVPRCAETATEPLPVMIFGHGLFGQAEGEMRSGYQRHVKQELCMIQLGTDWIGLSFVDAAAAAIEVVPDFARFPRISDRLQQAQLNFLVLARLGRVRLKDDPRLRVGDRPLVDPSRIYYYGISQGGIEGGTLLALSPDLERGVLNVGAGIYSLMMFRSSNFKTFKQLLDLTYASQRDQELLIALTQSDWDYADPISWAAHVRHDTLPGLDGQPMAPKPMILQEAIGDSQVPNLATRVLARTYQVPLLTPSVEPVPQLPTTGPGVDAAYVQWDVGVTPPAPGNAVPQVDSQAHGRVRKIPQLVEQLRRFFAPGGVVENTCDGACSFPGFVE